MTAATPTPPATGRAVQADVNTGRSANPIALAVTTVGAALAVVSLTTLNWFHGNLGAVRGSRSTVGELSDLLDEFVSVRRKLGDHDAFHLGLSDYYYSWLAWVLVAAAVVVAIVAALPTAEGGQIRILGALLSALGIAATLWALDVYRPAHDNPRVSRGPSFVDFLQHTWLGAWGILAAFVLIGAGALIGPRAARTQQVAGGTSSAG